MASGEAPETSIGGSQKGFQPTLWTTVLKAKNHDAPDRLEALNRLITKYWKPVYYFIRQKGHDVEAAKDLTQGFFATFLEKDFLKDVEPDRGRFRSFILAALSHFLSNEYDRSRAKKRGGDFNFVQAELERPSAAPTPEQAFFDQWAIEVFERAMSRLKSERPPEDVALLSGHAPADLPDYEKKNRLHRLRLRLRQLLREEVLPSVAGESEADEELRELLSQSSRRV